MQAVTFFSIRENSFTGMLPQSGLREVAFFLICTNRFTGALPDRGMIAIAGLYTVKSFKVDHNFFAGTVAESLLCSCTRVTHLAS
eukprot:4922519-Amphidinium_carterae.1